MFDQVLGKLLDYIFEQVLDQVFFDQKKTVYSSTLTENRLHANDYYHIFRAYQKNSLPAIYR